jgi:predicted transposase YbfD/YdcC
MTDPDAPKHSSSRRSLFDRFPVFVGAVACVLFGMFLALGVRAFWGLDPTPGTTTVQEQMMHRKTRTMEQILDGLVRGDLSRVEESAELMWDIANKLDWYLTNPLYEQDSNVFRDSTTALIESARQRDYSAAKESALRLERSCIECHELINGQ